MATITYRHVDKTFPGGVRAVRDLSLEIGDGEFMVIVGPSGCGKTTAMRLCAGLEDITAGEILIDGKLVNHLQPQQRNISMVFQNYALYPHMTVRKNLMFPLQMRKMKRADIAAQVDKVAKMLELGSLLDRKPKALSGGQRQRVAMGRALVREPVAFLMDEPLSNLDAKLRVSMRAEIADLQRRTATTTIYVTHDQIEAMTMGDRVAVMRLGLLQQVAPPQELYDHPANVFVAAFIGSPAMNLFRARLEAIGDQVAMVLGETRVGIPASMFSRLPALRAQLGREVTIGLRPESFTHPASVPDNQRILVTPTNVEALGHEKMAYFDLPVPWFRIDDQVSDGATGSTCPCTARLTGHFPVRREQPVEIGIDTTRLHAFGDDGVSLARQSP
jgi:multiple sugar transport system ATP-binding protein